MNVIKGLLKFLIPFLSFSAFKRWVCYLSGETVF